MSLEIYIPEDNPQFRLTSDSHCFIIESKHIVDPTKSPNWEKRKKEGADPSLREEWRDPKYYGKLDQALYSLPDHFARKSDATSLSELLTELRDFRREISDLLHAEG